MNEANARSFLTVAGVSAVLCYIVAIVLGLRGDQGTALVFLIVAFMESALAWAFYRQYTRRRSTRWQQELSTGEEKMRQALAEEGKSSITAPGEKREA